MRKTRTETVTTTSKTETKTRSAKKPSKKLIMPTHEEGLLLGKDEMNLVEHPFAVLKHGNQDRSIIRLAFEKVHPRTGKTVKSLWEVSGHVEQGLPGPTEERLYVALMQITREQSPKEKTIYFSRGDLMDRLGWPHTKQYYEALATAFTRLAAVTIRADRAFWDAAREDYYATVTFHVLEEVHISNEPPGRRAQNALPLSSFSWGDTIFQSLQAGYLRSLDTDFGLSLNLPLSLRLFRYLDRHRRGKSKDNRSPRNSFSIGLQRLCELHLGMAASPYNSKHKERLKPAHEELIERGFLASYEFSQMKNKDGEKVTYHFATPTTLLPSVSEGAAKGTSEITTKDQKQALLFEDAFTSTEDIERFQPSIQIELQLREAELFEDAANEVFQALPDQTRDDLWRRALEPLPLMFRENPKLLGAQRAIRKQIADLMRFEHEEAVHTLICQKIQLENTKS